MQLRKSPFLRHPLLVATIAALTCGIGVSSASDQSTGVDVIKQKDVNNTNATDVRHITFIHTGDQHGDFHAHPNPRDNQPSEGGLSRVYTVVDSIRKSSQNSFYVHTGDTIQGSAETLFTKGQAMIDVMNAFGVQAFAPGNWEFAYGVGRFREAFLGNGTTAPLANWGISAVNAYYNGAPGRSDDQNGTYGSTNAGKLLVEPYGGKPFRVETIDGVKVGIFGCTTNRGPQIVGANVTQGITFTNCKGQVAQANNSAIAWPTGGIHVNQDPSNPGGFNTKPEIPRYVSILRTAAGQQVPGEPTGVVGEGVDMVILLSEGGLAENIYNAEHYDGIDIIFSSDMHEETNYPVEATTPNGSKTLVIEEGEDGAQVGELAIKLKKTPEDTTYAVDSWTWKEHDVNGNIAEDAGIKALAEAAEAPFRSVASGGTFQPGVFSNPFSGTPLMAPLDEVVGTSEIEISRNRYSHEWNEASGVMPGVVEGTGHAIITDAFRAVTNALLPTSEQNASDGKPLVGAIRGFRYVNNYPAGSQLTYEDLYHFLSIGPQVAVTEMTVGSLSNQSESAADSCMNPNVTAWAGGWMFNFSGVTFDLDPYGANKQVSSTATDANYTNLLSAGRVKNFRLGKLSVNDPNPGTLIDDSAYAATATDGNNTNDADWNALKTKRVRYASYYYEGSSRQVNNIFPAGVTATTGSTSIRKIMRTKGTPFGKFSGLALVQVFPTAAANISDYDNVDATEVVAIYIKEFLNGTITATNTPFPRIHLTEALPDTRPTLGFPTIEPVYGMDKNKYYPVLPAVYSNGQIDQD